MKLLVALLFVLSALPALAQRPPMPIPHPNPYPPSNQPVWPRVFNYGHTVEVQAWNNNWHTVWCSGPVNLRMRSGHTIRTHVNMHVPGRGVRHHRINIREPNDRVVRVSHSIWCH